MLSCFYRKEDNVLRMKLSDLTYEILVEIVTIYDETVGGHGIRYLYPGELNNILQDVQKYGAAERRYGSSLTIHSKLWIQCDFSYCAKPVIFFRFDANVDLHSKRGEKIALNLERKFEEAVDEFLTKRGLAI